MSEVAAKKRGRPKKVAEVVLEEVVAAMPTKTRGKGSGSAAAAKKSTGSSSATTTTTTTTTTAPAKKAAKPAQDVHEIEETEVKKPTSRRRATKASPAAATVTVIAEQEPSGELKGPRAAEKLEVPVPVPVPDAKSKVTRPAVEATKGAVSTTKKTVSGTVPVREQHVVARQIPERERERTSTSSSGSISVILQQAQRFSEQSNELHQSIVQFVKDRESSLLRPTPEETTTDSTNGRANNGRATNNTLEFH
ncbi:hypothetical protein LTR40_000862 [Exophiala xenobiotica]|nr:hypothetical protein LTR40_000862 [Exophiala xenobiotica]